MALQRALGVDDLWFADHVAHVIPKSMWNREVTSLARWVPDLDAWYDPTIVIARYGRPRGPRLGTAVTDPYRRSPSDMARAWLSLHHATRGNVILGIGAGERMNLDPVGIPMTRPIAHLEDTLSAIRAVWSSGGERVSHSGEFHQFNDAPFAPGYRGTYPPIWVAAEGPKACEVAGRYGDGWMSFKCDFGLWRDAWKRVAAGAEAVGKDPETMERSLVGLCYLSSNPEHVEIAATNPWVQVTMLAQPAGLFRAAGLEHPLGSAFSGIPELDQGFFEGPRWDEVRQQITPDVITRTIPCGDAKYVAEVIAEFVDHGLSHVTIANLALLAGGASANTLLSAVKEHRKLIQILKTMRPRIFSDTTKQASAARAHH